MLAYKVATLKLTDFFYVKKTYVKCFWQHLQQLPYQLKITLGEWINCSVLISLGKITTSTV